MSRVIAPTIRYHGLQIFNPGYETKLRGKVLIAGRGAIKKRDGRRYVRPPQRAGAGVDGGVADRGRPWPDDVG